MATLQSQVQIWDPARSQWTNIDDGQLGAAALLLNILIELRINSLFEQANNTGVVITDTLEQLRADALNDPTTFRTV